MSQEQAVSSDTKIQIWKQFTTPAERLILERKLCHPIQRYKFESNSQRWSSCSSTARSCVIRYKDTNLKAIHNSFSSIWYTSCAVSSDTKIQIWKQFTTRLTWAISSYGCVIRYKDTNLKAIHNRVLVTLVVLLAVSSDTKIQIWKQFTTVVLVYCAS